MHRVTEQKGKVFLVGAGPGDPELITVRGFNLLQQADVVIYDRLVHPALLKVIPQKTEKIFVGKAPGKQMLPQEGIHVLLIERALQGCKVVRLKGGDPFVYGRGGEECLALAKAGITFEIVPGISSAIAAPAYAGIPVTHRGLARAFTVITGHASGAYNGEVDWVGLLQTGTLVIMMGLKNLSTIVHHLLDNAQSPETPVAVISYGSTRKQEVVEAPLSRIVECVRHLHPPATVVIGDVLQLRSQLHWFTPSSRDSVCHESEVFAFPNLDTLSAITQPLNHE